MPDQPVSPTTDTPAEVFTDVAFPAEAATEPTAEDMTNLTPAMEAGASSGMPAGALEAPASDTTLAGAAGGDAAGAALAAVVAATTAGDTGSTLDMVGTSGR